MNIIRTLRSTLLALGVAAPTIAQDENACRSHVRSDFAYAWDRGTASGYPSDLIAIRDCFGRIYACYTVQAWANMRGAPFLNGGRAPLRQDLDPLLLLRVHCGQSALGERFRGRLSGGRLIDRDPLR